MASNDQGAETGRRMACCGDTPTLEIVAAVSVAARIYPTENPLWSTSWISCACSRKANTRTD